MGVCCVGMWKVVCVVLLYSLSFTESAFVDEGFNQWNLTQAYLYNDFAPLAWWGELPSSFSSSTPITHVDKDKEHSQIYLQKTTSTLNELWMMQIDFYQSTFAQLILPSHVQQNYTKKSAFCSSTRENEIVIGTPGFVFSCKLQPSISCSSLPLSSNITQIFAISQANDGSIWLATDYGLIFTNPEMSASFSVDSTIAVPVTNVFIHPNSNRVFAATDERLWYSYKSANNIAANQQQGLWNFVWIRGLIDGIITSFASDQDGNVWIGNDICVNVLHNNATFERIGPARGLPFTNVTSVSFDSTTNTMWVGSWVGAARLKDSKWSYYYGPRWIAGSDTQTGQNVTHVLAINVNGGNGAVVIGSYGISVILSQNVTLQHKSAHYQATVPRHFQYGLTMQLSLSTFGVISSATPTNGDNDGLWTSMYLASQCFRYAATKDPQAKQSAWEAFKGLSLLNYVTGIKGLPARSAYHGLTPPTGGTWHNSSTMPGWIWKGDTSSDEIVGHLMVYPLFHDLVCENDQERALPRDILTNITHYIVENDFYLIDITGKPTTWGVWNPKEINANSTWYTQRGLNALQILSWLLSAYRISGDAYYKDTFDLLAYRYGYGQNIINQKITDPLDLNFSDDELAFLPYLLYLWTQRQWNLPEPYPLQTELNLGLFRAWNQLQREHPSLWNMIYSMSPDAGDQFGLNEAVQTLQEWPWSQIEWPVDNRARLDIHLQRQLSRGGNLQCVELLPYDEISMYRWNGNPYEIKESGNGETEADPAAWLLPYWLGVYLGHI